MNEKKIIQKRKAGPVFADSVSGSHGNFVTPAGKVNYLLTKATLRFSGTPGDSETQTSRLTRFLAPAREVLDVENLGFDQLLQRDLDDNRIVYELIPYLLGSKRGGTPLFPPIVVMVLPFDGKRVSSGYSEIDRKEVELDEYQGKCERTTFGNSFEFDRALCGAATPDFGILKWHYDHSRLVVLDGQHRAMALLGIQRIHNEAWPPEAKRFEVFYREAVAAQLAAAGENLPEVIELPVMLTWLPEKRVNLTEVVRKLFVDINSNARRPSPSRLLLLSDNRLSDFLTRRMLTEIRSDDSSIPLSAVEYDYPNAGRSSSQKWSCFTNVEILRDVIHWNVFRARALADNMKADVVKKGKVAGPDVSMSLREELHVKSLGQKFDDGEESMNPNEITNEHFPRFNKEKLEKLLNNFANYHAKPLIALFSNALPYQAHFSALNSFEADFDSVYGSKSINPALCREALFEGQGVYWTIKSGADGSNGQASAELARCWKALSGDLKADFEARRLALYRGATKALKTREEDFAEFFETLQTSAAQGGLALLLCSVQRLAKIEKGEDRVKAAKAIGEGISKGLLKNGGKNLLFLGPNVDGSLNRIGRLQPRFAGLWRYLWLETLVQGVGEGGLRDFGVAEEIIKKLLRDGREFYFKEIVGMRKKALHSSDRTKKVEEFAEQAQTLVRAEIIAAFHEGCGLSEAEATSIWDNTSASQTSAIDQDTDDDDEDSEDGEWPEENLSQI
jgi:hypothetical protein